MQFFFKGRGIENRNYLKKKSNDEINHKSYLLSSYYLSGTVLVSFHTLSHVVLITTCDVGTIIMPALQIRKLKLREII